MVGIAWVGVGMEAPEGGILPCVGKMLCLRQCWSVAVVIGTCGRRNDENADEVLVLETDGANAVDG